MVFVWMNMSRILWIKVLRYINVFGKRLCNNILISLRLASRYSKILSTLRKTKSIICWPRTRNVSFPCKYVTCNHHISLSNANLQQCLRFYYLRSFLYDTSLLFFIAKFWQHFKTSKWHYFCMAISCLLNSIESISDLIC